MFNQLISTHDFAIVDRFTNSLIVVLCTCGGFAWLRDDEGDIPDTLIGYESTRSRATRAAIADKIGTDCFRIVSM
jgi:hypothetical protein